jgi:tripartite-type tricarboxylate transporter receptor subunit TctC
MRRIVFAVTAVSAVLSLGAERLQAQPAGDFYKDKQIRLIIANAAGGDYDLAGRLLSRHITRHIPGNPTIIVNNMPGAGTIIAANYLYNVAPKDGTVFGTFSRNLPSQAVLGRETIKFDPRRFAWVGGIGLPSRVCVALTSSPIKKAEDLFTQELLVGGSGAGSTPSTIPKVLDNVLGMKFKIVEGYGSTTAAIQALERGEVDGICQTFSTFKNLRAHLLNEGKIRVLFNTESTPFPYLPDVPSVFKFAKTEEQKKILTFVTSSVELSRPFVLPPGTPEDRVAILRAAFASALKDPLLLNEADRQKIDVTYRSPEDLLALVNELFATPKDLLDRAADLVPSSGD